MKKPVGSTFVLVTSTRLARADFDGVWHLQESVPRPAGISAARAVEAALSLGGKASRETWVFCEDLWQQKVSLSPAQVAGLTREQLARALSFEIEPFSGISVNEAALGYSAGGGGGFAVVEGMRAERDGIERAVAGANGRLAGLTHPGPVPEDEEALAVWWKGWPPRLGSGEVPLIRPPAPAPSPHRFLYGGLALAVGALVLLLALGFWQGGKRARLEARQAEFTAVAQELEAANKRALSLGEDLAKMQEAEVLQASLVRRRSAIGALLHELAEKRTDALVVNSIHADGNSGMIVTGLSLDAEGVDELGIVLTRGLREAGWLVQARHKTGRQNLPNGGPWEFSLAVTHEEAARAAAARRTQGDYE